MFTEDGFILGDGDRPVRGREAIARYYRSAGGALAPRAFAFGADGSLGWILGGFSSQAQLPDRASSPDLRRDARGWWLIASDMDNSNERRR